MYVVDQDDMSGITFNEEQIRVLTVTSRILSGFSVFGLFFVLIFFVYFRNIRSFAFDLVAWLCLSNLLYNITNFFPIDSEVDNIINYDNHTLSTTCAIQAFMDLYFDLSSLIWTSIIGFTVYVSLNDDNTNPSDYKCYYRLRFILLAYGLPLIFSLM
jgi:hypothetical protein